ncbi:MAG: GntR family transcriptional regulator [Rhodoplanes sp.]|uniref:GntR family transcriptional regulator n=1 Tax=Rhodoplanes sp. TaxID=1968906 RepID=UPI0018332ADB|nr:GntR family transcriptional regulator [Rhodoplanes sp.]NVO12748.1 GntR family transcriptional regulator [Rhodoplanes sp.]
MSESELSFDVPALVSLSRQIEQHLERLIVQGTLKSGQKLSEPDIAKRFRTSRSPVREALRRLEQLGLVVIEPRRGASVKAPNERDIADMLAIREALEGMAARLAAERADDEDITRLRACAVDPGNEDDEDDPDLALVDFHEAVILAARNPALQAMLRGSLNLFRMVRSIPADHHARKALAAGEHMAILEAIAARDPDAAEAAARKHIRTMRDQLLGADGIALAITPPPAGARPAAAMEGEELLRRSPTARRVLQQISAAEIGRDD